MAHRQHATLAGFVMPTRRGCLLPTISEARVSLRCHCERSEAISYRVRFWPEIASRIRSGTALLLAMTEVDRASQTWFVVCKVARERIGRCRAGRYRLAGKRGVELLIAGHRKQKSAYPLGIVRLNVFC